MRKTNVYAPTTSLESLLPSQASTNAIVQICHTALRSNTLNDIVSSLEVLIQLYLYRPDAVPAVLEARVFDAILPMMQLDDPIGGLASLATIALCVAVCKQNLADVEEGHTEKYPRSTKRMIKKALDVANASLQSTESPTTIFACLALIDEVLRGHELLTEKFFGAETEHVVNLLDSFNDLMADDSRRLPSDIYIYVVDLTIEMILAGGAAGKFCSLRPIDTYLRKLLIPAANPRGYSSWREQMGHSLAFINGVSSRYAKSRTTVVQKLYWTLMNDTEGLTTGMIPYTMAKRILEYPSLAVLEDAIHTRFELDDLGAVVDDLHAINDILWCPDQWNTKCSALVSSQIPFRVIVEWLKVAKKESRIRWEGQDAGLEEHRHAVHRLMYEAGKMLKGICLGSPKRLAKMTDEGIFQHLFDILLGEMRAKKPLISGLLFAMSPALLDEDQADRYADELYRIALFDIEKKSWLYLEECIATLTILLQIPRIAANFFTRNLSLLLKSIEGGCARLTRDITAYVLEAGLLNANFALLGVLQSVAKPEMFAVLSKDVILNRWVKSLLSEESIPSVSDTPAEFWKEFAKKTTFIAVPREDGQRIHICVASGCDKTELATARNFLSCEECVRNCRHVINEPACKLMQHQAERQLEKTLQSLSSIVMSFLRFRSST